MKANIAAVYCRLSKEDMDKDFDKTESESIKNQRSLLEAYALERDWSIYDFYIDEDYSGSDRDRPAFNRLITDSFLGRFNIVLCKKQARFARDIEYVEKYIHGLFAERQIRFVAVLDSIDTGVVSRSVRKASQINSLVDEWYLSDMSENIISSLNTKRRNAEFIGSWAPYGYCKDPNNKNALMIDPEAAEIVKEIFRWYRNGCGINKIAKELNARLIPNPLSYKQLRGEKINPNPGKHTAKRHLWTPSTISAILHNQTYMGYLIQGKYRKASYKSKKLLRIPKSDWIIIPDCHECIIDAETWDAVQKSLISKCRVSAVRQNHHLTAGKVYCGECGSKLVSSGGRSGQRKTTYLCCSKHNLSKDACAGARIEVSRLEQILLNQINSLSSLFFDEDYLLEQIDFIPIKPPVRTARLQSELNSLQERSVSLERKKEILYSDKLEGIITYEQYMEFKNKMKVESESLLQRQLEIAAEISLMEDQDANPSCKADILNHFRNTSILTQDMVNQLVESLYIYKRKKGEPQQISINWNF